MGSEDDREGAIRAVAFLENEKPQAAGSDGPPKPVIASREAD